MQDQKSHDCEYTVRVPFHVFEKNYVIVETSPHGATQNKYYRKRYKEQFVLINTEILTNTPSIVAPSVLQTNAFMADVVFEVKLPNVARGHDDTLLYFRSY